MTIYSYKATPPKVIKQDNGIVRRKGWVIEGCFIDFKEPVTREEALAGFESNRKFIDQMWAKLEKKDDAK